MNFDIYYKESDGYSTYYTKIQINAADLETAKKAFNQWRVKSEKASGKKITVRNIVAL